MCRHHREAVQAVTTLQLNFVANGQLTWRRRVGGSGVGLWHRWGRFHLARGASLLVCVGLFPFVAPWAGSSVAYWSLPTRTATGSRMRPGSPG
jgi:putative flippase GtrA